MDGPFAESILSDRPFHTTMVICLRFREQDVLILSGDVSDSLGTLRQTLSSLRRTFGRVFFVPGNHDLWIRDGEAEDSVQKLHLVLALCEELGISVKCVRTLNPQICFHSMCMQ